ncbi:MAG: ABC transporter permease [Candidatus Lokiarchaeota archaeon]|nr:ABC transporter permease [Candidatus Lokiarchaeota archaeon]
MEDSNISELRFNKKGYSLDFSKQNIIRYLKFLLIPGWRDEKFSQQEYEIEKTKSKRKFFRRLIKPLTLIGIGLIFYIVFLAVYAPWIALYTLETVTDVSRAIDFGDPYTLPSPLHPWGTTAYAYDLFSRIIWGSRTAVTFGILTIIIATLGGIAVGTISGYYGGKVDTIIMRIVDFTLAFPTLVIVIIFTEMVSRNLTTILTIFGMFAIPSYSRLMRASVLETKEQLYIEAAKTSGAKNFKIMFKHIFSNAISPIIIRFFGGVGAAILGFAGIAFLGFGDEGIPDWGTDLNYGRGHLSMIHTTLFPGIFILLAVLGFMLLGDGLRDALDPRLKITMKRV